MANFMAGADTSIFFQAYAATGVDASNTVSLDLHGSSTTRSVLQWPKPEPQRSAFSVPNRVITANGTDVPFTFNFNGTDDFVALTFVQINAAGGTANLDSADLDNLTVTTIPEPSSSALLGLGALALVMRRRK